MISCDGTYAVSKIWEPLKQEWQISKADMRDTRFKLSISPGWGSRLSADKKLNALQLLFLASKPKDFDYYGNLECVLTDKNMPN